MYYSRRAYLNHLTPEQVETARAALDAEFNLDNAGEFSRSANLWFDADLDCHLLDVSSFRSDLDCLQNLRLARQVVQEALTK